MRLVACDVPKFKKGYRKSEILELIEEFVNSENECVKIEGYTQKDASSCYGVFWNALKRYNIGNVKVRTLGNDVYLVKVKTK